jgi:small-conductance mechanosensitive channel
MNSANLLALVALAAGNVAPQVGASDSIVAQEETANTPVPAAQAETDELLRDRLAATFSRIPGLTGVEVGVEAGVVILSGTVLTSGERALADSLASRADGVLYVTNRIVEETSVGLRLRPLLETAQSKAIIWLSYLPLLLLAGSIVLVFFLLARFAYRWEAPFKRMTRNPFLRNLIRQAVAGSVAIVGIVLALELLDATALVGAVLGAAGVLGIAVGFAFRNIAENYLAGIILSLRQPFSPDDYVRIEGEEGRVIRLTSRETLLMTLDGNHLRIPNATIFNSVVQNFTRNPLRRFSFELSVGQSEDLAQALEVGRVTLDRMDGILNDPAPRAAITEVGDSWVVLRFFCWVDQRNVALDKAKSEAVRRTMEAVDAAGIAMPAPEYGLRFLDLEEGARIELVSPRGEAARRVPAERGVPSEGPSSARPTDLEPDRALDEQIARDREEATESDLLNPSSQSD